MGKVSKTSKTTPMSFRRPNAVPALIKAAGIKATRRYLEFLTAQIRNRNTREAYHRNLVDFFAWCDHRDFTLDRIEPILVAAYVEYLTTVYKAPTVKQHLAAIRMCFDWLVTGQIVPSNPASSVRGPKHVVKRGKTPVLSTEEARQLLDSIDCSTAIGLRDRALIGIMIFTFARVSAVLGMSVSDYYRSGKRAWIRLHEKGGKFLEVPAHHKARAFLEEYISRAELRSDPSGPLFRAGNRRSSELTNNSLTRRDALKMVKRRCLQVGLSDRISCHSFRATGITAFLANDGLLEKAQQIAGHESPRTTKLYDRTSDEVAADEIEKIVI